MPNSQFRHPSFITRIRNLERMREISEVAVSMDSATSSNGSSLRADPARRKRTSPLLPSEAGTSERCRRARSHVREVRAVAQYETGHQPRRHRHGVGPLQDHVTPFPFDVARQVIEEDLGLTLDRAFECFDEDRWRPPIGQVYAAVLPGGRQVIVKVQRPEAGRQIRKDVDLLLQFADLAEGRIDVASLCLSRAGDLQIHQQRARLHPGGKERRAFAVNSQIVKL